MTLPEVFDSTHCTLGEGPLWADGRLWWFDIPKKKLLARVPGSQTADTWDLPELCSAAARTEEGDLLLASETGLWRFDPASGSRILIHALEEQDPATRSNDGRADRQGGFWIGTMSKTGAAGAGALYRYRAGEMRRLRTDLTTPNAICFAPDGRRGYFSDTRVRRIFTWPLDEAGWPEEEPSLFIDLSDAGGGPDGAVVDAEGALWVCLYGGGRVIRILPDASIAAEIELPARQPTCPAFGGDLQTLYVTTARQKLDEAALEAAPFSGAVFAFEVDIGGIEEPKVQL